MEESDSDSTDLASRLDRLYHLLMRLSTLIVGYIKCRIISLCHGISVEAKRGRSGIKRMYETRETNVRNTLNKLIKTIVFGGIVAGVTFAVISPFVVPTITSFQANGGYLVDEPKLEIGLYNPPDSSPQNFTNNATHSTYVIVIENTQNRPAQDLRLNLNFSGCIQDSDFYFEGDGHSMYPSVEFDRHSCSETIFVPTLAKGEKLILEYTVDESQEEDPTPIIIEEPAKLYFRGYYIWELNGMMFSEATSGARNSSFWQGIGPGIPSS